ncbi:YtxH domain-containing protein [Rubritalea spongiae]|uniref:YtxH domain-containing protein n=1 Tax=Rubritalea spongiae TaxID=430797 RepID=A0ABW5E2Y0_9BACT
MKLYKIIGLCTPLVAFTACEKQESTSDKVEETVEDALDQRPAEEVQDAGEDIKENVEDAAEETGDAIKEATD